jgi:hypothetical protein
MLALYKGANEEVLREALHNQKEICDDTNCIDFWIDVRKKMQVRGII